MGSMVKLHLGCGRRYFGDDWIHIDRSDHKHIDQKTDVRSLIFKNNSVDMIYASHVIAYFDNEEIIKVLEEWNRVLKPGGLLRIATPNLKIIASLLSIGKYPLSAFIGPLYGKMKSAGKMIYHKSGYDFWSLKYILGKTGFENVRYYDWRKTEHSQFDDHSQAYLPHMDKKNGILISLNVECNKI